LSKEGAERLSIFEDFLEKLDFDKPGNGDKDNPEADSPPDKPKKPKKK